MTNNDEREAFEAAWQRHAPKHEPVKDAAWRIWQAARQPATAQPFAPAGDGQAVAEATISKPGDPLIGVSFLSLTEHGRKTLPRGSHHLYATPTAVAQQDCAASPWQCTNCYTDKGPCTAVAQQGALTDAFAEIERIDRARGDTK